MRRRHLIGIVLACICLAFCTTFALAEEVRISVAATPDELSEAGNVELNFSISNYSDYELHNVTITSGGMAFALSSGEIVIPPNGSVNDVKLSVNVPESQIGLPVEYTVSWTQGGEPRSENVSVTINRAADPVITLTRNLSTTLAREGEQVLIEYVLTNSTKFDMTDIQLIDDQISDKAITKIDTLLAGNSMKIEHNFMMGTTDVTSTPVITYSVRGKTKSFSAIEPASIGLMLVKLSVDVKSGTPTASGVQFTLDIKNIGNQAVKDITVFDEKNNFVTSETFSMEPGDAVTYPYLVVPVMTEPIRNVSFKINGTDAQGNPYTLSTSQTYPVYPYVDESQISAGIRAETLSPWSAETGVIKVRLTISNASQIDLSNVQISELSMGIIKLIEKLDKGETVLDLDLSIGSPRNLSFAMKGVDPAGAMRELGSAQLQVAYSGETAVPSESPLPESTAKGNTVFSFLTGTLSKILLALGILMCVAFVALLVLSILERKRMADLELDMPKDEPQRPMRKRPPQNARPAPRRTVEAEIIDADEAVEMPRRTAGDTQRIRRPSAQAERPAPYSRASSMSRENDETASAPDKAYRYEATYRPARVEIPPEREVIPIEVEYDDEIIQPALPPRAPSAPIRLTDGSEQARPKVIRAHEATVQKASSKGEIRRVGRHDDSK